MNNLFKNSFITDDLLSTHPIINDNLIYPDETLRQEYDQEYKKKNNIDLQLREKIIIVSSKDRNPYTESINNFSIFFNPNNNHFEKYPVYYNNPTIPQTYEQRNKGIKGDPNLNGWKDKNDNIFPAYNSSKPPGDIICYDSILISATNTSSIIFKLNNIISIKVEKIYIFEENIKNSDQVNFFSNSRKSFININLSNIESNFITNFYNHKQITDFLYKDERFLGWWISVSSSEFKYHPPTNSFNNIKINWDYGYNLYQEQNKSIYNKIINFTDNNNNNFSEDILIIYSFEISNNFIILKTSFFSDKYWEDSNLIQIKNIRYNIDYSLLSESQKSNIESLIYFLDSQDYQINFTSLVLNNQDNIQNIDSSDKNLVQELETQFSLKNRIIINLPINIKYQNISYTEDIHNNINSNIYNSIGLEKIKLSDKNILLSNIFNNLNNDLELSKWKQLNNIDFKCLKVKEQEWLNEGPYIINISKQSIVMLKITYLEPNIEPIN